MAGKERRLAHKESMSVTGDRLTRLMKDCGVSISALAAKVRVQQSTLHNFRQGHRNLPTDVLESMARVLGTSTDFLLDRSEDPRPTPVILEAARLRNEARIAELA